MTAEPFPIEAAPASTRIRARQRPMYPYSPRNLVTCEECAVRLGAGQHTLDEFVLSHAQHRLAETARREVPS